MPEDLERLYRDELKRLAAEQGMTLIPTAEHAALCAEAAAAIAGSADLDRELRDLTRSES